MHIYTHALSQKNSQEPLVKAGRSFGVIRRMCYEVKCSKCGKTTWGGCGFHVASVYKRIPEGQHCQCKGWPGVKPIGATGEEEEGSSSSSCSIL
ncbi:hypothetical protein HanRHA438_Chr15g0718871 [Helianthus annuus]|uniref:Uncharacterized protein n=1 Tax=Helianthus annuus TaxID=4232 RepID=A0A9K3E407_HELAN|nr:hypothetical protein HanXRQr2_Chr15g0706741 [Helianthus annuus]KAJ0452179.1 hypothetical protein HanHA300_Chr15g0576011 [Helianthus annuus]KAJ0456986.1 hypothetical protein HanIR_Chr15g0768681 [Helianthus annuus]KAJ0474083.1 hypothetical protein HanHA89_Chr15g0625701 [Helianthus annuus]KAJ0649648.1 hypothetical protein HanLR1_Chr15g0586711 [Helianthus annuus]